MRRFAKTRIRLRKPIRPSPPKAQDKKPSEQREHEMARTLLEVPTSEVPTLRADIFDFRQHEMVCDPVLEKAIDKLTIENVHPHATEALARLERYEWHSRKKRG